VNRLVAVPSPALRESLEAPQHLDTIVEFAGFLDASRAQVERLVVEGMPYLDLSIRRPGRLRRRALRFNRVECVEWARGRGRA